MKVLRLQNSNQTALPSGLDWFNSSPYTTNEIDTIPDPSGGKGGEPTSIPSPFARMEVVRTAFKNVNNGAALDTTFYKIVSDCLDIAEIVFYHSRFKNIKFIEWDQANELNSLCSDQSKSEHKMLGETLSMYISQDASSFNFDVSSRLYLIQYQQRIIGGTSPVTLFYTTADDLSHIQLTFPNGDRAFDSLVCPLHKRNEHFQIMLYSMRKFYPNFDIEFREFSKYMDDSLIQLNKVNPELANAIYALNNNDYSTQNYNVIDSGVYINKGLPLLSEKGSTISIKSDFEIASDKFTGVKPLVLIKNHRGLTPSGKPMKYYTANYQAQTPVGHFDSQTDISKRMLPGLTGIQYPYVTISDFLEPYIIRTIFPINKEKFSTGNYVDDLNSDYKGYLLPLKRLFFDFFDIDYLNNYTVDGHPNFEIRKIAGNSIKVTLRVAVSNQEYITYERIYFPPSNSNSIEQPDLERNKGVIIENQFTLLVYPFIKTNESNYRICLIDRDIEPMTRNNEYKLNFYSETSSLPVDIRASKTRSNKANEEFTSQYYILEKGFDYIEIKNNWTSGIIIPKFQSPKAGTSKYKFAIDFGTTNTHIEYSIDDGDPKKFEIDDKDIQLVSLHDPRSDEFDITLGGTGASMILRVMNEEMMPDKIGREYEFSFPTRSVIGYHHMLNHNTATYALADYNLSFYYEKFSMRPKITKIKTNLKWANYIANHTDVKLIEAYFENLLLLIRNKVLINGGDLDKTELIWFFPTSMLIHRQNLLERTWNELFKKYITKHTQPTKVSESIAPFYYYNKKLGIAASLRPIVSFDIGGGTSDLVIYDNNRPITVSSFRFAANSIFGDGFNGSPQINGFVLKYLETFRSLLLQNNQPELVKVLDDVKAEGNSEDIIAFLFSVANNRRIRNNKIDISLNKMLSIDDNFKIIFLLFYSALIFHLSKVLLAKNLQPPRYIIYSGTGSKALSIIGNDKTLQKYTELLFSIMMDSKEKTELKFFEEAKEVTCKGGLLMSNPIDINGLKSVLLGDISQTVIPNSSIKYSTLSKSHKESVINEYSRFIELFFSIDQKMNFQEYFGLNPSVVKQSREIMMTDSMDFLNAGIERKLKDLSGNMDIELEETLFFYPIIGSLNKLAHSIYLFEKEQITIC